MSFRKRRKRREMRTNQDLSLESLEALTPGARVFAGLFMVIPIGIGLVLLLFVWGAFDGSAGDFGRSHSTVTVNGREFPAPRRPGTSGEFGGIPTFFKLFASLIASAFILTGIGGLTRMVKGQPASRFGRRGQHEHVLGTPKSKPISDTDGGNSGYTCGNCGAALQEGADVSPSGDVKCSYCHTWFNIHQS